MADMLCHFCRKPGELPQAIDEGWVPSFWRGDQEQFDPVCGKCVRAHLVLAADGEFELRPVADQPTIIV
jgi:hypothetical protein